MSSAADRVRSLIHESELSQHDFALRIGLDDSKLSKSLSGTRRFSSLDLARIAELRHVSVDWLITGDDQPLAIAARTSGGSAKAALTAAKRLSTMRSDLATLGYPQTWQPVTAALGEGRTVDQGNQLAEWAVARVEEAGYTVGTNDLAEVVERVFGADVAVIELGTGFDGLAASADDVKLIVLSTTQVPWRQRFTLAHELGHLLAGDDHGVHLDEDVFAKTQQRDISELRANAFAASFLMPADALSDAVGTMGLTEIGFASLACDLMVSPSALAYRLLNLHLIDAGNCDRFKSMSGAKAAHQVGKTAEWAQHVARATVRRPPGLLLRDTYAAYEAGATTLRPYADLLGSDVDELRDALESEAELPDAS